MNAATPTSRFQLPDGSRSAQSPWVWRGFFLLSLVALGLCISFVAGHQVFYAVAWGIIAAGWFATSMWIWRQHLRIYATQSVPHDARRSTRKR